MLLIFGSSLIDFLALVVVLIGLFYWHYTQAFKFWEEKGLSFVKPSFPAGNMGRALRAKESVGEMAQNLYKKLKKTGPFAGFYMFNNPNLLVIDPEMVKTVLVRDFDYFHDRGWYLNEKHDPLSAHLFSIEGAKWRNLRLKLSPVFTSGKMKQMFPIMLETSEEFTKYMEQNVASNSEMEIKEPLAKFTTDIIGTCAFGINCNSLKDPDAEFRKFGKKVFESSLYSSLRKIFFTNFKKLSKQLGLIFISKDVADFFLGAVKDTIEYREKNNISRNDFMQLMIQLKNKGKLDDDDNDRKVNIEEALTFNEVAAQAFVFFLGGFETSSTTMSFATYELALRPDIQEKAREEVHKIYRKYDGKMTYEGLHELEYLDMIIYETMRKYPTIPLLSRNAAKDYTLPGTSTIIPAGTRVFIPVLGLHHDPEYYPEPDMFDPQRFTEEKKQERHPFTYLPFGEGPRICIGMRFGMMQTRLGLMVLLKNYRMELAEQTPVPLKINPRAFLTASVGGIWLKLTPL